MSDKLQSSNQKKAKPFGEVVESDIYGVCAQAWEHDRVPDFASLVKIRGKEGASIGCVTGIRTGSSQPGRQPFAYGLSFDELAREQPQIFNLLATWVDIKIFAYEPDGKNENSAAFGLAPKPSQIHAQVQELSDDEFVRLSKKPMFFFRLLSAAGQAADIDQISSSIIRKLASLKKLDSEFFEDFYEQYSRLPDADSRRARILFMNFSQLLK